MIIAPPTDNEQERIQLLQNLEVLETEAEKDFDNLVKLASQICKTPISLVSLVDTNRQWFKARVGLDAQETDRDYAFCAHAIHKPKDVFVVEDTLKDERFHDNPLVTGNPDIRFYAGVPLEITNGVAVGTLCVIDRQPKTLTDEQTFSLQTLAKCATDMLRLRLHSKQIQAFSQEVAKKNQELARQNELKQKIISIISHDVRSPLASLRGFINAAKGEFIDFTQEELSGLLGDVDKRLTASERIVEDILQWVSLQIREKKTECKPINLQHLIEPLVAVYSEVLEAKHIDFESDFTSDTMIESDEGVLRFLLRNVVYNAIKFTEHGIITVGVVPVPKGLQLYVNDTGVGIDETDLETLFDWDSRTTTKGTHNEKGSGLGLLLCRDYAQQCGGDVWVESKKGQGTTVHISLHQK